MKKGKLFKKISTISIVGLTLFPIIKNDFKGVNFFNDKTQQKFNQDKANDLNQYINDIQVGGYDITLSYQDVPMDDGNGNGLEQIDFWVVQDAQIPTNQVPPTLALSSGSGNLGELIDGKYSNTVTFTQYSNSQWTLEDLDSSYSYTIFVEAIYAGGSSATTIIRPISSGLLLKSSALNTKTSLSFNSSDSTRTTAVLDWSLSNIWVPNFDVNGGLAQQDFTSIKTATLYYNNSTSIDVWRQGLNPFYENLTTTIVGAKQSKDDSQVLIEDTYDINGEITINERGCGESFDNVYIIWDIWSTNDHTDEKGKTYVNPPTSEPFDFTLKAPSVIINAIDSSEIISFNAINITNNSIELKWNVYNYGNPNQKQVTNIQVFEVFQDQQSPISIYNQSYNNIANTLISDSKIIDGLNSSETHNYMLVINYDNGITKATEVDFEILTAQTTTSPTDLETNQDDQKALIITLSVFTGLLLFATIGIFGYAIYSRKQS